MTKCKLIKGLLGASALTAFSAGTAFAQTPPAANGFTEAGTTVSNTFTLNYDVNNTPQTQINNIGNATEFNVDRLVNVNVLNTGSTSVISGQFDALLPFVVTNLGNDTHAYELGFEQGTASDDFDPLAPSAIDEIIFYDQAAAGTDGILTEAERAVATPTVYDLASGDVPVLAPDERVFVFVRQNIPTGQNDTDDGGIVLYADTQTITSAAGAALTFVETTADTDGNNTADALEVENVLADENGPASTTNDDDLDGAHSAIGFYIVENPNVTATKEVYGVTGAPGACDPIPAAARYAAAITDSEYFIPNSCVEYVIEVRNDGSTDATNIDLTDVLPDNLTFHEADVRGDLVLPTTVPVGNLSAPSAGDECDGTNTTCNVELTNATLAAGTVGWLVIRATIY